MSIWEEAKQSVRGSIRVMRLDPDALQEFNLSLDGYWRSFYAAAYLIPIYVIYLLIAPLPQGVGFGRFWLIEIINYPLSWALWPLAAYYLCRGAGVLDKYLAYITVYNWAQVVLSGGYLFLLLVTYLLLPAEAAGNLALMALVAVFAAETLIIRLILGVPWPHAIMIEALALILSLLLRFAKQYVMTGGAA